MIDKTITRKFTIGMLEIRQLILTDYLYILAYLTSLMIYIGISITNPEKKFLASFVISWAIGFHTISSPFGLRFRNIIFSLIWLIFSLIFMINNKTISIVPLATFLLYHILRIIFWKFNGREFIPFMIGKGSWYRHKSKFENRAGNKKDKLFTGILLISGILLILSLLFLNKNI